MTDSVHKEFVDSFKTELKVASPGRINLIGEHTDYNKGFVLPTAIDKHIIFQFQKNNTPDTCNVYSATFDKMMSFNLNEVAPSDKEWENYILGVVSQIQLRDKQIAGFDCIIESYLPMGSGISSSAALECGLAFGLNQIFNLGLEKIDLVKIGQKAEHTYVGTQCGIMDQFASVMSEKGHVILLDCDSIAHQMIPADFGDYQVLLLNTNVSHNLADSAYNTRVAECASVVKAIAKNNPEVTSLREATFEMLAAVKSEITPIAFKRATYVLEENARVEKAVKALKEKDLTTFGELMYGSHNGLQNDYEVSCEELDFLAAFSKNYDQVLGARMMGGGFGGCTINLIHKDGVAEFVADATKAYKEKFNIDLTSFTAVPSQGTAIIN
ncbi:galactokinase [Aquimarina agarilytica]|uniref:galactokinase n=1 Tax=Aquimarina agarilytica TaxID=1087449 RepID=UPI000287FE45|nr:galactokinase [Aquimarina agarilytica]